MRDRLGRLTGAVASLPRELAIALVVTVVVTVVAPLVVALLTKHTAPVWVVVLAALLALLVGLVAGRPWGALRMAMASKPGFMPLRRAPASLASTRRTSSMCGMSSEPLTGSL